VRGKEVSPSNVFVASVREKKKHRKKKRKPWTQGEPVPLHKRSSQGGEESGNREVPQTTNPRGNCHRDSARELQWVESSRPKNRK